MNLQDFFKELSQSNVFQSSKVFIFTGTEYPVLFFSLLKTTIAKSYSSQLRTIDLLSGEFENFKGELSVPFLGTSLLYWCGNSNELDTKNKKKFFAFVKQYDGPHCLLFFSDTKNVIEPENNNSQIIELPNEISFSVWQSFADFLFEKKQHKATFLQKIIKSINKPLTLDRLCLLAHYSSVLSSSSLAKFIQEWLEALIVPDKSLFLLSTYFFAKKPNSFFTLWHTIRDEYPPQFWIVYWSEQLFRATCFVKLARANKFLEAKKIAYRLPFTLIKSDWRNLSSKQLAEAHHLLYKIDYRLKNGGDPSALDLFYTKFFTA